jgi:hypothetical protein
VRFSYRVELDTPPSRPLRSELIDFESEAHRGNALAAVQSLAACSDTCKHL